MEPSTQDLKSGAGKNKRKWSKMEDEKLIETLLELVNAGIHKADNGFRPGYLAVLEDALLTKLPRSDLKAWPHIESRIKTLKKDFIAVYDMHFEPASGFGWNDKIHVVTAPNHVWDAYLKMCILIFVGTNGERLQHSSTSLVRVKLPQKLWSCGGNIKGICDIYSDIWTNPFP